jgi:hypothetical protein
MSLLILGVAGCCLAVIAFGAAFLRYRVTETDLEIRWLFLPLRRIGLREIKFVSTKPVWYSEKWYNTLRLRSRRLIIYCRNGSLRPVSISPRSPFVLKAELDAAIERVFPHRLKVVVNANPDAELQSMAR